MEYTRDDLPVIVIPRIDVVFPDVDPEDVTDQQDIAYNRWANEKIVGELKTLAADGADPVALTRYPADTVIGDVDSRDVVTIDDEDNIIVLESEMMTHG